DSKRVENLFSQKVLREIQSVREGDVNKYVRNFESFQSVQANGSSCVCSGYNCGCCADLKWDVIHLDDTGTYMFIYFFSITFTGCQIIIRVRECVISACT
ncbi:hypothetical protein DPMN_186648, partial [Dreissena polymorpha]